MQAELAPHQKDDVDALKAGDPAAWQRTLTLHGPRLLDYATGMLGDRAAAEDVVQSSMIRVYRGFSRFEGRCSVKSWLFRAVHNRAIDELRFRKRFVDVGEDPDARYFDNQGRWARPCSTWDPSEQAGSRELLRMVRAEIERLPHDLRDVLLMVEVQGLPRSEVCDILGITSGNLRVRLHRARRNLRAALADGGGS